MPSKITSLGPRIQLAALPWRRTGEQIELMMITSRLSRHWLIPKGWPMKGKTNAQAAAREAFEEAGVKGVIAAEPLGRYDYDKLLPDGSSVPCQVEVYALQVEKELPKWPEARDREREWMPPEQAAALAFEAGLGRFLATLSSESVVGATAKPSRRGQHTSG